MFEESKFEGHKLIVIQSKGRKHTSITSLQKNSWITGGPLLKEKGGKALIECRAFRRNCLKKLRHQQIRTEFRTWPHPSKWAPSNRKGPHTHIDDCSDSSLPLPSPSPPNETEPHPYFWRQNVSLQKWQRQQFFIGEPQFPTFLL